MKVHQYCSYELGAEGGGCVLRLAQQPFFCFSFSAEQEWDLWSFFKVKLNKYI